MAHVLLVDDEPASLAVFSRVLRGGGHDVATANAGAMGLQFIATSRFDVIVSDVAMPGMNGLQFLRAVREQDAEIPVVLFSGAATLESALEAIEQGAYRYLTKPFEPRELAGAVESAARLHRLAQLKREALALTGDPGKLLGDVRALEAGFARAVASLWMTFEPIVSWQERRLHGYEALVRTDEPALACPAGLLTAAERLGSIQELGRVIRSRTAAAFGAAPADALLFVNLHPIELRDADLYDPSAPLSHLASRVVLEITERTPLEHIGGLGPRVHALKKMGFRIAVDDLGAGYAGLGHFALLEPDVVKLDMSLIRDVDRQPTKQSVVRSMIGLCRELGLTVISEGIETSAERDTIAGLGCDLLQGFLFARSSRWFPVPRW
jgi:EAL domain-containing protein (putative c-di-GMP-specific phosphodiesterase class I)